MIPLSGVLSNVAFYLGGLLLVRRSLKHLVQERRVPSAANSNSEITPDLYVWAVWAFLDVYQSYGEVFVSWAPFYPEVKLVVIMLLLFFPSLKLDSVVFDMGVRPIFVALELIVEQRALPFLVHHSARLVRPVLRVFLHILLARGGLSLRELRRWYAGLERRIVAMEDGTAAVSAEKLVPVLEDDRLPTAASGSSSSSSAAGPEDDRLLSPSVSMRASSAELRHRRSATGGARRSEVEEGEDEDDLVPASLRSPASEVAELDRSR